jgi:hypothetical protein
MIFNIADFKHYSNTYIETGSCYGESIQRALDAGYTRVKSVELHEPFYRHCVKRFKGKPVELYLGKSTDKLDVMLADVYEPSVIFLDAHPAGPNTGGHEDLMEKGDSSEFSQNTILRNELEIILDHPKKHLIIIDDLNGENPFEDLLKGYQFLWFDEHLTADSTYYSNKILVCYC